MVQRRAAPTAGITRRRFFRLCSVWLSTLGALASGCTSLLGGSDAASPSEPLRCASSDGDDAFDYVVVGSGAGGGPLAANLALAGFKVLLLEAGGDEQSWDYEVPAFHARASEDEHFAWNFYVRHYADDAQQRRDPKFRAERDGVLYPRCATLGGCTAHNAMILIYPHDSDWDHIAAITGDPSWASENMRHYFERLERCEYARPEPDSRHGFQGWLTTNVADPLLIARDRLLKKLLFASLIESLGTVQGWLSRALGRLDKGIDPNGWRFVRERGEGLCMTPITTHEGRRVGTREYIRNVQRACGDRLVVRTHALATRVVLDDALRATGVEYFAGSHLYRADPRFEQASVPQRLHVTVKREVILCAGAFNTPQLLKLSGIGPRVELERHGIPVRVDLPGVGENLQDRYEISVVTRMTRDFSLMKGMKLRPPLPGEEPDPQFRAWLEGRGPYTSNGAVVSMVKRSAPGLPDPDLFIFGLLGSFKGYFPGYAQDIAQEQDVFTWAILKAHTRNTGHVSLRSNDPRDMPEIDFRYFEAGPEADADLEAVVEGVQTVRNINERCREIVEEEIVPGKEVDTREKVRKFIKDGAWGHHACGTCKIGAASDATAVVDSQFRVRGMRNLRVVDASIFPKIPGFFIVSAVYMASEKASDVIVADARKSMA
ncbi:MAG TPA: GMC oxidoreductase [Casimicrobiaceae bacterium]